MHKINFFKHYLLFDLFISNKTIGANSMHVLVKSRTHLQVDFTLTFRPNSQLNGSKINLSRLIKIRKFSLTQPLSRS